MWGKYTIFMYIVIIFPELIFSFLVLTEIQRNKISLASLKVEDGTCKSRSAWAKIQV